MENTMTQTANNGKTMNTAHGSPFDRGSADSWYHRAACPHYYSHNPVFGTTRGERVEECDMTEEQVAEYKAGYEDNEKTGGKKDFL